MADFDSLDIRIDYSGLGHEILEDFVLPVLREAVAYDRVTSFFTTDALVAVAFGLDGLHAHAGSMRLVIGLHDVPVDLAQATATDEVLAQAIDVVRHRLMDEIAQLSDELARDRLATLAWMIQDGFLEVRVAAVLPIAPNRFGIFHNKAMILRDSSGNVVAAVGSPNETGSGLGANFEHLTVFTSWDSPRYTEAQERFFDELWSGSLGGVSIHALDSSLATDILESLGERERPPRTEVGPPVQQGLVLGTVIDAAKKMPAFSLVSGQHTALYAHQERAYLDALSRWPVRVLLADEVGLGKTFEAGAIVSFMMRFASVGSVVILCPKAVVHQWQGELQDHFGIDAWVYDSGRRSYISPEGSVRPLAYGESPVGARRPSVCILSAQFARGSGAGGHIFDSEDAVVPDLLVVDEAHSARVRPDISGSIKPTLMWRMLDQVSSRIPHVVFATATPMQTHWREYHALLRLLGLPEAWRNPGHYERSLKLVATDSTPSALEEGAHAARLILASLDAMRPSEDRLTPEESNHVGLLAAVQEDVTDLAERALSNWPLTRSCLVKLHPAHLLTVRNTRSALERVGYQFPERNLYAPALHAAPEIRVFYMDIEEYLSSTYFEVERALYPDRKFSVGFVKCSYQQRLASSLTACRLSLSGRRERLLKLTEDMGELPDFLEMTAQQVEDSDMLDEEIPDLVMEDTAGFDSNEVMRLARIEAQYIDGLLARADSILAQGDDPKLTETTSILRAAIAAGDQVLVFSRYTDTLDAVLQAFLGSDLSRTPYGVFTGGRATMDVGSGAIPAGRREIRDALSSGAARIIFCSDAASEGLNLQAARVLINVDVPWNPARLEQRIGRIARLGQKAKSVDIFNIWYPESIEARMYERLGTRKRLYDLAVGEFPEVVSESIRAELSARFGVPAGDRDPLAELQALRNESQVVALRKLWSREVPTETLARRFREDLVNVLCHLIVDQGGQCTVEHDGHHLILDGRLTVLETEPGSDRVASLNCTPFEQLRFTSLNAEAADVLVGRTDNGSPAAFGFSKGSNGTVPPDELPRLLSRLIDGPLDGPVSADNQRPAWIPTPSHLTIPVELEDVALGPAPKYWPPTSFNLLNGGTE